MSAFFQFEISEQRRIVAVVQQLMRRSGELEAQIVNARATAAQLLEATLHHLLAG